MSAIATAIIGGAVVGAVGVGIAGSEAGSATRDAANTAAGAQYAALAQQAQLAAPYTGLGQDAIAKYEALLGIGPKGSAGIQQTLQSLPGYQFTQQQGADATKAQFGAMGMGLSGNMLEGLDTFNTGLANQNYNQYLQQLLNPIQIGQGAAAGQAANIQTGASNLGNIAIGRGNAMAGIDANTIAGLTKSIGGGVNNYLTYQTLQNLNSVGGGSPVSGDYAAGMSGGLMPAGGGYNYNAPFYTPIVPPGP
jgi:hypothetical protein